MARLKPGPSQFNFISSQDLLCEVHATLNFEVQVIAARARTRSGLPAGRRRYELLLRRGGHSVSQDDDVNQGGYYRGADPAVTSFDPFSGVARVGFLRHVV